MIVHPGVEFKPVVCDGLFTERYFGEMGAHVRVELVPIHAEIGRGIPVPDQTRKNDDLALHGHKMPFRSSRIPRGFLAVAATDKENPAPMPGPA
jgi:hypothetical protein